jgi:3-deoxy-manno-octulosonate cytidylyltransferase (CMP-KDO synthetase)
MKNNFCVLIPARYESKRLPGKPLILLNKKSILLRTFNQVKKIFNPNDIYVFTDKEIVKKNLRKLIPNIFVIKKNCENGTVRCSFGLDLIKSKYKGYLIISCDFPFISNNIILKTLESFKEILNNKKYAGATVHVRLNAQELLKNKKIIKVVLNKNQDIMYLSRLSIPSNYKYNHTIFTHHGPVCLKYNVLKKYKYLKDTPLQLSEDNEWLKLIENGHLIRSKRVNKISIEINDKDDLKFYKKKLFLKVNKKSF